MSSVACVLLTACPDDEKIATVTPEILVQRRSVDFGPVLVGASQQQTVPVFADSRATLSIVSVTVEDVPDPSLAGGAQAFTVVSAPQSVAGETREEIAVAFQPPALGEFSAVLVIVSDDRDSDDSTVRVALHGTGGRPELRVVPECAEPCRNFVATAEPPSIDFGLRPVLHKDASGNVINEPVWPTVRIYNDGPLPMTLKDVAFTDVAFSSTQSINVQSVSVPPGGQLSLSVVFNPTQATSDNRYAGELVIAANDSDPQEVRVALKGELAPNTAPKACAAVVGVLGPDGELQLPRDPNGQVTFGGQVAVQPGQQTVVYLSAFSDHFVPGLHPHEIAQGDQSLCTTDLEDGRAALLYHWTLLQRPDGSAAVLVGDTTPEPTLHPDAAGDYTVELTVADPAGLTASAQASFRAIPQRDLAVELTWEGQPQIDLDLHLVKPGACGQRSDCVFDPLGDVNGFSSARTGGVFDWGEAGNVYDDPRLEKDDQGNGSLIESIALNRPENDPSCASAPCTYEVYVHYFKDWRDTTFTAPACPDAGCSEGSACSCPATAAGAGSVCVSGRCVQPARPAVKVFVRATPDSPDPVATIPLDASEVVELAGPCFMWHVARVTWPSLADLQANPAAAVTVEPVGSAGARTFDYYGVLEYKSFSCSPNTPTGTPDDQVTYLPGTIPTYPRF